MVENMIIDEAKGLIDSFHLLPIPPEPETTIFSIGGRGYYENPTTDMLAFFFDPSAPHNFGEAIIQVFFDCLNIKDCHPLGAVSIIAICRLHKDIPSHRDRDQSASDFPASA